MKNVGDNAVVGISSTSSAGTNIYAYVWKWWDASSTATIIPTTNKLVNIGGQPTDNRLLRFSVSPVSIDGSHVVINGSFQANNPPYIVPSPTISVNDEYFPYQTQLRVTAYDLENDVMSFSWFEGTTLIGVGATTFDGTVQAPWSGNGTTVTTPALMYTNGTTISVSSQRTVRCVIMDSQNGTSFVDFVLRGFQRPPPSTGIQAEAVGLTSDSTSLPIARIGPNQSVTFEAFAKDVNGAPLTFLWGFTQANNWTVTGVFSGTDSATPDGGFRSVYVKDISTEVITSGTQKVATAVAQVNGPSGGSTVQFSVTLLKNNPPTSVSIIPKVNGVAIDPTVPLAAGTKVTFEATPSDPDNDICEFKWIFNQNVFPTSMVVYGPKVVVDTTDYSVDISGQLVCTDQAGGSLTVAIPTVLIT